MAATLASVASNSGGRIKSTPATAVTTDSKTDQPGLAPSIGQLSKATQIGKTLVIASTLDTAPSRVMAKKQQTRLTLPARLRIQSEPGRRNTSLAPLARARISAKRNARPVRNRAITCQSQVSRRAWTSVFMTVNAAQPESM